MGGEKASWLHISDLHILLNSPSWEVYRDSLFRFFKDHPDRKPDFVVVTGDYHNIQKFEAFALAERFIRELLKELGLCGKNLYLVPGNHDMSTLQKSKDTVIINPRYAEELQKLLPDGLTPGMALDDAGVERWLKECEKNPGDYIDRLCSVSRGSEDSETKVHISTLLEGFRDYEDMAKSLISWYSEIGSNPAQPHNRKWKGTGELGFNIVHLNTALAADGSRGHYQAMDLEKSLEVLQVINNGNPTLVLAHNSFYDLHPQIQEHLKEPLSKARACAWLCGDEHIFRTDRSIPCPVAGGVYSVPIYVCGKGAPDHGDDYSENGFCLFESDGQNLTERRFLWSLAKGIQEEESATGPLATPDMLNPVSEEKKRLLIGYLSCNPEVKFEDKYHLGHAYFIRSMDERRKMDQIMIVTSSYVFKPNRTFESVQQLDRYAQELVRRWEDCFNREVRVIDIKQYLQKSIPKGEKEQQLLSYVTDMELQLEVKKEWMSFIEKWVETEKIEPTAYHALLKVFEIDDPDSRYTQDEVMSFAHLLYKRPTWYSTTWMVNFIYFWNTLLYPLVTGEFGYDVAPDNILIVEAKRNHYVWDAVSYCAKRFSYDNFPRVEYIENLLDKDCRLPMKSSNRNKAVYLADYKKSTGYSGQFQKHVHQRFDTDKSPDELCEEFSKRLGLDK